MGNLSNLLKQAMNAKEKIEELQNYLGNEVIEASAGGGMVNVTLNGRFEVLSLQIDREIVNPEDPEMLETLIVAALNEGVRKTQEIVRAKMQEITGGLEIPGFM